MNACPLGCGPLVADEAPLHDNRLGLPHTVRVAWCPVCGLGITLDTPTREELAELYERRYVSEGDHRVPRSGPLARVWHTLNGSLPLTDLVRRGPVLDVGCNTGEALVALRRRGLEVVGLEPNPEAAAIARGYGLEVIEASIEEADLPVGRFETVLLSQVLEHVHEPHRLLRLVRETMRPDAEIYLVVPNADSVFRKVFGADWVHWHVPFHLFHFTERALRTLAGQCGLALTWTRTITSGEWLLMTLAARRNARRGQFELAPFSGRYARRLLVAPAGRIADAFRRGDAIVARAQLTSSR